MLVDQLLDDDAEDIVKLALAKARKGDGPTIRALLGLIALAQRVRPIRFEFPQLKTAQDAITAFDVIAKALADGELSEPETKTLVGYIEQFLAALNVIEYEARIKALEERIR